MTDVNQLITNYLDIWTAATDTKSSAGRGNGGGVSLYGMKKLRELILELAIRGKLVSQDETDEPAYFLLEGLKDSIGEKQKSRKQRGQTIYDETEPLYSAPAGWCWTPLSAIADVVRGVTYKKSDAISSEKIGYVPLLRGNNIDRILNYDELVYVPAGLVKDDQLIQRGDIVIAMSSGSANLVGKAAQANDDILKTFGAFCGVVRPISSELNEFFRFFFQTPLYRNATQAAGKGIGINNLNKSVLERLWVPLPPTEEQHRIVAKVDELMALCDALERQTEDSLKAHQTLVETCLATLTNSQSPEDLTQNWTRIETNFDTLFTTEESVEAFRRAALDLALRGLLTEQISSDAPASDLLRKLYDKNKKSASSRHRTIVSKIKKTEPPFDLPESWAWSNLGLLSSDLRYGTSKKCDRDDSLVPVLRIPNVSGGQVDLDDMKFGPLDPKEVADLKLRSNDLLIIRSNGSLDIVGSFAVVPELEGDFAFAGYLVRVRIDRAYVDPRYIWYVSRSRFLRDQIEGPIRHGVGLKNVNSTELASLAFPIPPREEQERIVDKLDGLFETCDQFTQLVRDRNTINLTLADTLTSKIH